MDEYGRKALQRSRARKAHRDYIKKEKEECAVDPETSNPKIDLECMECGHKFKRANPTSETRCPKCHGYDIDVA